MMAEYTVTPSTKFGFGSSTKPSRAAGGRLTVAAPAGPDTTGTIQQISRASRNMRSRLGGTYCATALYLDGKRVIAFDFDGWIEMGSPLGNLSTFSEILCQQGELRVRTEEN